MKGKGKYALMTDMVHQFADKFGYDTPVELEYPVYLPRVYDVGTPSITKIKVVGGDSAELKRFPYRRLHFYVDFYSWGWTDERGCWAEKWEQYLNEYGLDALASALNLRIVKNITYTVEKKKTFFRKNFSKNS